MQPIRLPAIMESLHEVQGFVVLCAEKLGASPPLALKLELVLEEMVVNVISYAYVDENEGDAGELEVVCSEAEIHGERALRVDLKDWGTPFDPLKKGDPDLDAEMDDRPIGGLGIHMVKEMSDEIGYAHKDGANVLTVYFKLNPDSGAE